MPASTFPKKKKKGTSKPISSPESWRNLYAEQVSVLHSIQAKLRSQKLDNLIGFHHQQKHSNKCCEKVHGATYCNAINHPHDFWPKRLCSCELNATSYNLFFTTKTTEMLDYGTHHNNIRSTMYSIIWETMRRCQDKKAALNINYSIKFREEVLTYDSSTEVHNPSKQAYIGSLLVRLDENNPENTSTNENEPENNEDDDLDADIDPDTSKKPNKQQKQQEEKQQDQEEADSTTDRDEVAKPDQTPPRKKKSTLDVKMNFIQKPSVGANLSLLKENKQINYWEMRPSARSWPRNFQDIVTEKLSGFQSSRLLFTVI